MTETLVLYTLKFVFRSSKIGRTGTLRNRYYDGHDFVVIMREVLRPRDYVRTRKPSVFSLVNL